MVVPKEPQNPSQASLEKEDITSIHSSDSSVHHDQHGDIERGIFEQKVDGRTLTEKGDIEAYPDSVNEPPNAEDREWERENGPATRVRTKESWKDPGPPPDGGWSGWKQGSSRFFQYW